MRFAGVGGGVGRWNHQSHVGNGLTVSGNHGTVIGNGNHVTGNHNKVVGNDNRVTGNWNTVTGHDAVVRGHHNTIVGEHADVEGQHNTVRGHPRSVRGGGNRLPSDGGGGIIMIGDDDEDEVRPGGVVLPADDLRPGGHSGCINPTAPTGCVSPAVPTGFVGPTGAVMPPTIGWTGAVGPTGWVATGPSGWVAAPSDDVDGRARIHVAGPSPRGEWDHRKTYRAGDTVTFAGGGFVSIADNNRAQDPVAQTSHWALLASYTAPPLPAAKSDAVGPAAGPVTIGPHALGLAAAAAERPAAAIDEKASAKAAKAIPLPPDEIGEPTADEARQCGVCLTSRACTALIECGHSSLCVRCARSIVLTGTGRCPLCTLPISRVIRTY